MRSTGYLFPSNAVHARSGCTLIDRGHRDQTESRGGRSSGNAKGSKEENCWNGHVLTPGRYVSAAELEDDGEPFDVKMPRLMRELEGQFGESARLEKAIRENMDRLGFRS